MMVRKSVALTTEENMCFPYELPPFDNQGCPCGKTILAQAALIEEACHFFEYRRHLQTHYGFTDSTIKRT